MGLELAREDQKRVDGGGLQLGDLREVRVKCGDTAAARRSEAREEAPDSAVLRALQRDGPSVLWRSSDVTAPRRVAAEGFALRAHRRHVGARRVREAAIEARERDRRRLAHRKVRLADIP
jgi:hypothetical protein